MRGIHVYVDIDDVLAETTRAIHALARTLFGHRVDFEEMLAFDLADSLRLDADEHATLWQAIHADEFLTGVAPMAGAVEAVTRWHREGAEISVVTGRPPTSRSATEQWLAETALPYHRLEIVDKFGRHGPGGGPTREEIAERGYALVIEDAPSMAAFLAERTDAEILLVDRPWNRASTVDRTRIRRMHDWTRIEAAGVELAGRRDAGSR